MISRDKHVQQGQRNVAVVECPLGPRTKSKRAAATLEINRLGGGGRGTVVMYGDYGWLRLPGHFVVRVLTPLLPSVLGCRQLLFTAPL